MHVYMFVNFSDKPIDDFKFFACFEFWFRSSELIYDDKSDYMFVENPYQEDISNGLISINMNTDYRFSTWGLLFSH